jgi:hypothetical protein
MKFFNMDVDKELQNYFINHTIKYFKDDDINFNNAEITKMSDCYRFNCNLMFNFNQNKNSLFFRQKLEINDKYQFRTIITFREYTNYIRKEKLKNINNGND